MPLSLLVIVRPQVLNQIKIRKGRRPIQSLRTEYVEFVKNDRARAKGGSAGRVSAISPDNIAHYIAVV